MLAAALVQRCDVAHWTRRRSRTRYSFNKMSIIGVIQVHVPDRGGSTAPQCSGQCIEASDSARNSNFVGVKASSNYHTVAAVKMTEMDVNLRWNS